MQVNLYRERRKANLREESFRWHKWSEAVREEM